MMFDDNIVDWKIIVINIMTHVASFIIKSLSSLIHVIFLYQNIAR